MQALVTNPASAYRRREPDTTVLYRLVQEHLATFLARASSRGMAGGGGLPGYVRREFDRFLSCGILCKGFCRVHCDACNQSALVAFACKARAVCPSCTGRRMAETAAHLCDHVLPEVPVRQWVLSLPHPLRFLMARDPDVLRLVRGIFVRAVQSFYARRARDLGHAGGRTGTVVCVQRFDSALRLDPHLHALVLDGVYTGFGRAESLAFRQAAPLRDEEVEKLVGHIRKLILGRLQRLGHLDSEARLDPDAGTELDELGTQRAAAIQGLIPFGPRAGLRTAMMAEREPRPRPAVKKKLCADLDGFSLHAAVRVSASGTGARDRLERLCRYVTRPPLTQDRLSLTGEGDVVYRFRHPWKNGKTAVVLDPMTFLSRLAAQVPPPRRHVLTYHGVLAPAASKRELIVPGSEDEARVACHHARRPRPRPPQLTGKPGPQTSSAADHDDGHQPPPPRARPESYSYAELMLRVFRLDILACPCGARRRVLSLVCDPTQIRRVLEHMGLPADPPERAPPRAVQRGLEF